MVVSPPTGPWDRPRAGSILTFDLGRTWLQHSTGPSFLEVIVGSTEGRAVRRSIELLEAAGFRCLQVMRSSGPWDVVGIGALGVVLVRCCCEEPSDVEFEELREYRAGPGVGKLLHHWRAGRRLPDVRQVR